jgi:glycine/D-amino acid oxidase-like deaminating enzyme
LADAQAVALAHQRSKTAADLWQGQAEWRVIAATGAAWEPVSPSGYLVHDTLSARINPHRACAVLAMAVRALGGEVLCNKDAFGVVLDAQPRGLDTGGAVLWATGLAGLDALSQDLGRSVGNGVKGQALALGHNALHAPQLFVDGLHVVPHADGTVAIGSTSEHRYDDPVSTDAQLDALHARAIAALPILATAPVVARWAAVRPRAVSRAPLLGAWPGREGVAGPKGVYVANGGFKIGFGIAPKVAEVMADLILEGRDTIPQGFGF